MCNRTIGDSSAGAASLNLLSPHYPVQGPDPVSGTAVRQRLLRHHRTRIYIDCAVLIRHKMLFDSEVKVCLLQYQLYILSHCRTTVSNGGSGTENKANCRTTVSDGGSGTENKTNCRRTVSDGGSGTENKANCRTTVSDGGSRSGAQASPCTPPQVYCSGVGTVQTT